ncbi:hypothetical protein EYC84_004574 [Monilinia fructicola]|uniref:Uncharacterized protein n=1 Tax=Monilinia fructicola TaxID=38448 RepID=A0A5M9K0T8_MONFR|nr:hypothetical protein EYC84_004574 [Monilinia fructicola]
MCNLRLEVAGLLPMILRGFSEGIRASLRAFSSSVRKSEAENDQPRSTRAERSSNALAHRPVKTVTIARRIDSGGPRGRGPNGHSPNYRGRGGALYRAGAGSGAGRGGARVGAGGRAGGARRGRGSGQRAPRGAKPADVELDEYDPPYTLEEQQYLDSQEGGEWVPYNPVTSLSDLESWGPAVATSASTNGLKESIIYKVQVASGTLGQRDVPTPPDRHLANVERGFGTVFESREEKEAIEKWKDGEEAWRNEVRWKVHKDYKIAGLNKEEQEALLKEMVAGVYKKPGDAQNGLLGDVERLTRKNETFLPEDSRSLQETIQSYLPADVPKEQNGAKGPTI